jgi:hypothetical protein
MNAKKLIRVTERLDDEPYELWSYEMDLTSTPLSINVSCAAFDSTQRVVELTNHLFPIPKAQRRGFEKLLERALNEDVTFFTKTRLHNPGLVEILYDGEYVAVERGLEMAEEGKEYVTPTMALASWIRHTAINQWKHERKN